MKPAFNLGSSSPHPRLPPGPFEVIWKGRIVISDAGPIAFSAGLCGELTVTIDGIAVLSGRGDRESAILESGRALDRPPGVYRLAIRFRSLPDRPARVQLSWQSREFSREPVPAWVFVHESNDETPALRSNEAAEIGRSAVERYGCSRCHSGAFDTACNLPGPSLADVNRRVDKAWLLAWLEDPAAVRADAHMPALFAADRAGFVERWILAERLIGATVPRTSEAGGDHRAGRVQFISVGCAACHVLPDLDDKEQIQSNRTPLIGLAERLPAADLAAFLGNPHSRYPDGRMPRLPLEPATARDIASYLLLWSKPAPERKNVTPPTADEILTVARRLNVSGIAAAGNALIREKHCAQCHTGLGSEMPADLPIRTGDGVQGCLAGKSLPRYRLNDATKSAIVAFRAVAARDRHPSPYADRQRALVRAGCVQCHQRDSDRPSMLEAASVSLGGSGLETVPFQRAPRLSNPHRKFTRSHLLAAVSDGVQGLRAPRYTFLMPAYGHQSSELVRALAEADGEVMDADSERREVGDPTLGSLAGPTLVGSQGYACVSCHVWKGRMLADQDPASTGPDLTRVNGRIRRDWFDRYLESPTRSHPGTPMPAIFPKGQPAPVSSVLDGDSAKQRDALWAYFSMGQNAPSPKPPPPLPLIPPANHMLIAQMPMRLPGGKAIESITGLAANGDAFVYDLGAGALHSTYVGAQVLRAVQGRLRTNSIAGVMAGEFAAPNPLRLIAAGKSELPVSTALLGYDREDHSVRIRRRATFSAGPVGLEETIRFSAANEERALVCEYRISSIPKGCRVEIQSRVGREPAGHATVGKFSGALSDGIYRVQFIPDETGSARGVIRYPMPAAVLPPSMAPSARVDAGAVGGSLVRPGYRAIAYPRPKSINGDDLIMPGALAVNPKDGRVFVASLKSGAIYVLRDPNGDGRDARFDDYASGVFQDSLAMLAEPDALYVMHRRNLTRITDGPDGRARRFDRVTALTQDVTDSYDYGYGLVRDRSGAFVYTYAPYGNTRMPGAGSALRLKPDGKTEEIAYGFRNPLGWCSDTHGEIFFTDNQGEWVATNKLCHLTPGRFFGFPNPQQPQHASKPRGRAAVWVPYAWAHSLNGVTCDTTGGKFGPFRGQFFMAELVFGGAIIRADLERVNGEYQGACFPFWGPGLLGPLTLGFDPKGRLFVGSITEPGWMAQPDRGGLFRIDYTGELPLEMRTIRALPGGFRVEFTRPVTAKSAGDPASYQIQSYRYEYTGAYGSPELDRAAIPVVNIAVAQDGLSAELTTAPLTKDRVYLIQTRGVRSASGEPLVHPVGAYTLNEIPSQR